MFYLFIKEKPLDFPSGQLREHGWVWVWLPLTSRGEEVGAPWVGRPTPLGCLLLPYKRRVRAPPLHTLVSPPFLSTRCSIPWSSAWRSPDRGILHSTTSLCCWISGGSSTSAAPLDRGNGGRHQAVRVTDHGDAQRTSSRSWYRQVNHYIIHEIWSCNVFGLRGWVLLRHPTRCLHLLD